RASAIRLALGTRVIIEVENWILNAAESSFLSRSSDPVSTCFISAARKAWDGGASARKTLSGGAQR
ncbi:hypothetical protein NS810_01395, partial [Pseudomonas aeruginosa]|nr:hypothetical protein [Pseudomonas aeruginosa]